MRQRADLTRFLVWVFLNIRCSNLLVRSSDYNEAEAEKEERSQLPVPPHSVGYYGAVLWPKRHKLRAIAIAAIWRLVFIGRRLHIAGYY